MATTAFHSVGLETLRRSEDRFARRGFRALLRSLLENWRAAEEERVLARFAGWRWCDSTERQIIDALSASERRTYRFGR
ncbi:MAG: hypothetical protein ACLQIQ_07600 [Beijerinckiaceae bacterium]